MIHTRKVASIVLSIDHLAVNILIVSCEILRMFRIYVEYLHI